MSLQLINKHAFPYIIYSGIVLIDIIQYQILIDILTIIYYLSLNIIVMQELKTNDHIKLTQPIFHLTSIVYDQYSLPDIEEFIDQTVFYEDSLLLYRNRKHLSQQIQQNQELGFYYLMIQVFEENNKLQFQDIDRVIGLGNMIVVFGVDRQKEVFIEKRFYEMAKNFTPSVMREQTQIKNKQPDNKTLNRMCLHFVNTEYKASYMRKTQNIYYWRSIKQIEMFLRNKNPKFVRQNSLQKTSKIKKTDSLQFKANQEPLRVSNHSFTIEEMINLFKSCQFFQKGTFDVKQTLLSYKQLQDQKQWEMQGQKIVYEAEEESNPRKIEKTLSNLNIGKVKKQKLQWKYRQLRRFRDLVNEQQVNKQLVIKYKSSPLYELSDNIINLEIQEFYRPWVRSTLRRLKKSFNMIANRRDTKAIDHFRNLCEKTRLKIEASLNSENLDSNNKDLLKKIKVEINDFIEYHQLVIQGKYFFSGTFFYRKQIGYLWRNQRKVYEKLGFFLGMVVLALIQDNVILGCTIVALGLIFSAVNI